jgi:hypothetical protein
MSKWRICFRPTRGATTRGSRQQSLISAPELLVSSRAIELGHRLAQAVTWPGAGAHSADALRAQATLLTAAPRRHGSMRRKSGGARDLGRQVRRGSAYAVRDLSLAQESTTARGIFVACAGAEIEIATASLGPSTRWRRCIGRLAIACGRALYEEALRSNVSWEMPRERRHPSNLAVVSIGRRSAIARQILLRRSRSPWRSARSARDKLC